MISIRVFKIFQINQILGLSNTQPRPPPPAYPYTSSAISPQHQQQAQQQPPPVPQQPPPPQSAPLQQQPQQQAVLQEYWGHDPADNSKLFMSDILLVYFHSLILHFSQKP